MSIRVIINGKEENLENEITIYEFLKSRNIRTEVVTIEHNGKIVNREDFRTTIIREGDELELIYFMGGGMHN
jgi:thiamine biosynthesis protein ThiS